MARLALPRRLLVWTIAALVVVLMLVLALSRSVAEAAKQHSKIKPRAVKGKSVRGVAKRVKAHAADTQRFFFCRALAANQRCYYSYGTVKSVWADACSDIPCTSVYSAGSGPKVCVDVDNPLGHDLFAASCGNGFWVQNYNLPNGVAGYPAAWHPTGGALSMSNSAIYK
jgi:hypothetical protein